MSEWATTPLKFSVVVASRNRPEWLKRCLTGLRQLDYPKFEIIVVADGESIARIEDQNIKRIAFEEANLSKARNVGATSAGGDFCAFIDDDAVPEPLWLSHFNAAVQSTSADAVTGYVRGRNGISYQSQGHSVDAEAETHDFVCDDRVVSLPVIPKNQSLKLVGTNMAIKREALSKVGGFDESFRFYLEDSDISLRLMRARCRLALQPLAQVHHGFAPSCRRDIRRAPLDLFEIGRSTAIFLRKHLGKADEEYWKRMERRERARLLQHMVDGTCEPRDVSQRIAGLRDGWEEGVGAVVKPTKCEFAPAAFRSYPARSTKHVVLASPWFFRRRGLKREAEKIVSNGGKASVFSFSLTPVRHHVRYIGSGVWMQTGGLYGRSDRIGPRFRWCRFAERLKREIRRVAKSRGIGDTVSRKWWDQMRDVRLEFESEDTR